jgi:3-hydroxyacyl-CoA dehydrogenase / enoyl-CoA hydratase / 3-hydroxybutyryl-CoA epimerase
MNAFSFEIDAQGICIVTMDLPDEKVNKVTREGVLEIENILNRIENEREIKAAVIISGKEDNFIAGGDINEFLKIASVDDGRMLSLRVQEVLNKVENARVPFVAAIHGACLGGGLEIALACEYRIATDDPKTVLGLPEVQLGLIPGAGGTQRLPRLLGIAQALDMILTGKSVNSKKAKRIGLVDELAPKQIFLDVAKKRALLISSKKLNTVRPWVRDFRELLFEKNPLGRKILFDKSRKEIMRKTHSNYLAPIMALEAVEIGVNHGFNRGLHVESAHFGELSVSDTSRQLINIFFSTSAIKKDSVIENREIKPCRVEKIGIVGAGFMGSGIASVSADIGIIVRMKDKDDASVGKGLRACYDYFMEKHKKGSITKIQMEKNLNLISGASDYTGFRRADLVIEAVHEDLELKRKVLEEAESFTSEDCIFASNTSSLAISQIGSRLKHPGKLIGMHFFSHVHRMTLLEIVRSPGTSEKTIATALDFGKRLGKTPIVVKDGVGFYTTRILAPYINEATHLISEGAAIDDIDRTMVEFGFPVGPLMLLDEIGIDVGEKIGKTIYEAFGGRLEPSSHIERLIQDGRMGRKNKKGFYTYNGKMKEVDRSVYDFFPFKQARERLSKEEIEERLLLSMVNEAILCLQEEIIRSPRDGDIGAVMGLGFPPFLGGPFRYVDSVGASLVTGKLEILASRFSPRFVPARLLIDMARRGQKFYRD